MQIVLKQCFDITALFIVLFVFIGLPNAHARAMPDNAVEIEMSINNLGGVYLSGGPEAPIVLIVPGSGPTDRDGNSPMGIRANTYAHLAKQLSQRGISTIRVDKRGLFSSQNGGDPNQVTISSYAQDYQKWIDHIKSEIGVNCVFLLGHSEGGLMVTAAAKGRDDVCGLILAAAPGRRLGDILRAQLSANPANEPILNQAFGAIETLEAGQNVDTTQLHPALGPLFNAAVQDFLISVIAVDPVQLLTEAGQKTLIIQGTTDLQISLDDAKLLSKVPDSELVIVAGVNHVLKPAPPSPAQNFATYTQPDLPVSEQVIDAVETFINRQ